MPSRRMIDPDFWKSETMAELTIQQRLLFIGLFSNADDQGRLRAHPGIIRSMIFPLDDISQEDIQADLQAIAQTGSLLLYSIDGREYMQITGWWKYQTPQWAYPSKIPAPQGWKDRLRYRHDNKVVKENWDDGASDVQPERIPEPSPTPSGNGLGNALPKDLPNALGGSIVLDQYSNSIDQDSLEQNKTNARGEVAPEASHHARVQEALVRGMEKFASDFERGIDLVGFPEELHEIIRETCALWGFHTPTQRGRRAKWIDDARLLRAACGEFGLEPMRRERQRVIEHMEAHKGLAPYTYKDLGSLIGPVEGMAAQMRVSSPPPRNAEARGPCKIVLPDGTITEAIR